MNKLISILIPTFNEFENIESCYLEVKKELSKLTKYDHEIIILDNKSTDGTFDLIKRICQKDKKVRAFKYSNNFGIQKSLLYGYKVAKGDAIIQIDCDLQDSPKLFIKFIEKWQQGFDVVYGIRNKRTEGIFLRTSIKIYYWLLSKISNGGIPVNAGDFRLISKKIVTHLLNIQSDDLYIRGAIAKIGFNQIGIEYEREIRKKGTSKFNFFSYVDFAFTGITQYSSIPLRGILYLGIIIMISSLILILYYLFEKFYLGINVTGFATLVCLILFSIGLNSIMLGLIGEYLNRVYTQTKAFNSVIIDEEINN
tara:strand:+ start:4009 stop:4938 length:930 start_codon:yes stop_codon:yes gene_type:complete